MVQRASAPTKWIKRFVTIAGVLILLFAGILTAKAFGYDVVGNVIQWTEEAFSMQLVSDQANTQASPVYAELAQAMEDICMDSTVLPTWIPDGYIQDDLKVREGHIQRQAKAKYVSENGSIKISVVDYLEGEPHYMEQSGGKCEVYEKNGVLYYLTENSGQLRAAWIADGYECYIIGPLTTEQLKQMIDSIGKG